MSERVEATGISIRTLNSPPSWTGEGSLIIAEPWVRDARCAETDPDLFFPDHGDRAASVAAKKVCASCDVAVQCLEFALRTQQMHGVWGGTTTRQRTAMRRQVAS